MTGRAAVLCLVIEEGETTKVAGEHAVFPATLVGRTSIRKDTTMAEGTIKTLHRERGYGFIMADGESSELYFDRLAVAGTPFDALDEEQRVMFTTAPDPLKPERLRAEDVRVMAAE